MKQFGWYLELNAAREYSISINGEKLDYSEIIGDRDEFPHIERCDGLEAICNIRYVRWKKRLIDEYSHYYFIGSDNSDCGKETTTLNNKGDKFYHSVYIQSDYFDTFRDLGITQEDDLQPVLPIIARTNKVYKGVREKVDLFLKDKRRPFLSDYTNILIQEYEQEGVFPHHNGNEWDNIRHKELKNVVRQLYQIEPRIFVNLNTEQKKTFVHLLNLLMDVGERDSLLTVLGEIVNLAPSEVDDLANILKTSKLSNVIKTIKLIEDRCRAIDDLRQLVFNRELGAKEPQHIQKMIENHYWIFGEQYHLVTAAEPKFEEALRRYIYEIWGEKKDVHIDHKDKNREMDIFMVRWERLADSINNIVVELKNPRCR
jgi:hypothetical protein